MKAYLVQEIQSSILIWFDSSDYIPEFKAEEYDDSNKFHRELIEKD